MDSLSFFDSSIGTSDLIFFFSILLITYIGYFYFSYLTRENPLPGPLPLPFVGNITDRGFDNFIEYTERMREKYGDMFEIYFGPKRFIMLSKYEHIVGMFGYSLDSKYMRRVPHLTGLEELDIAGKGVALNHNVNTWKYNRQFISRALLTPSFSAYAVTWTQRLVEEMMEFWKDASNDDGCFETDLVEWAHRFTTDSITHFTTGKKIHAVEALHVELLASRNKKPKKLTTNNLTNATRLFKSIRTLVIGIYFFIIVPSWMRNYLPFLSNTTKNYLNNRDWLFNKFDEIIKQRRKEIEHTPRDQPLRHDMLTSMITINTDRSIRKFDEEHYKPLTDEEIRGTLWETWVAGMDTVRI